MGFNPLEGFPTPKAKSQPAKRKKAPTSPAAVDKAVTKAVRSIGRTTTKATPVVTRRVARAVARNPKPKVDPLDAVLANLDRTRASSARQPQRPQTSGIAGLSPLLSPQNLQNDGRSLGGFLENMAQGGLDIVTSIPAQAQLVAEAGLYPFVTATNLVQGGGTRGRRATLGSGVQRRIEEDLKAAGTAIKQDYAYRYGPLAEGNIGEFGSRFYDNPTPTILDVAGAKGIIGRTPNVALRGARAIAPASRVGMAASRSLSTLSAAERANFAKVLGEDILPGPGGRYRQQRVRTSTVARPEDGAPVIGQASITTSRRAYSGDAIARARQKGMDKLSATAGRRIEERANRLQPAAAPVGSRPAPLRTRAEARVLRPLTTQRKLDRAQRSATREIQDLFDAKAEVALARSQGGGKSAIAQLKPDKTMTGKTLPGLSVEEAAFALHRMDMLGDVTDGVRSRGGLAPRQLLDTYLRRIEGEQKSARSRGLRTENSAAQVAVLKAIPDELLDLTDMTNPRVKRVAAAVDEARRLNANAQLRSVESGIIKPKTALAAASRDSGIGVGGVRWAPDVIRKMRADVARKNRGTNRAITAARARGDMQAVRRLTAERKARTEKFKERVAAVRSDAMNETPEITAARRQLRESDARLRESATSGKPSKISAATRSRDRHMRHLRKLEDEALGFTSPRRPELVGTRGTYVPDNPIDVTGSFVGPKKGGRLSGPDKARRSKGSLKARGNIDLNPALVLHQHARAMQNYTGRISRSALDELISTAAYIDPKTGKALTGDRLMLLAASDSERVRLVHVGNLKKALHDLDELAEGKFLDDTAMRELFLEKLPEGARASDYVAISKAAADVWTEAMTSSTFLKAWDKGTNYWKGGLLALSPRWYVNNTVGLSLQYGLMTGFDFRAIRRGNSAKMRRAMEKRSPNTIKDTLADDLTGGRDIPRMIAFGFKTNAKLEEFWRRAAYMNRAKQAIKSETGRFRKMSDTDIARAIENMPESMAREIVSDVDFFIGNYRKFNKLERDVIKRVIPFYSWLRVVARLTFALPFRSPVRAAAISTLATAAEAGINPADKALDYFERGALQIGGKAIPTWGLNPWQTLAPVLAAFGEENPAGALAEEGVGWVHPGVQFLTSLAFGTNNFGQDVIAPPGSAAYGQDPESFNAVTGRPSRQRLRLPIKEAFLSATIPGQISVIRRVAAGGRRPYDTVETADVVLDYFNRVSGGKRNERLYTPVSKRAGRKASSINPYSTVFGVPVYDQNDGLLIKEAEKRLRDFYNSERKLARTRKKAERG